MRFLRLGNIHLGGRNRKSSHAKISRTDFVPARRPACCVSFWGRMEKKSVVAAHNDGAKFGPIIPRE
jgi:hypothetical protein